MLRRVARLVRDKLNLTPIPFVSNEVVRIARRQWDFDRRIRSVQEALGRIEARQLNGEPPPVGAGNSSLHGREFRVYSQWGEDGILQFLCRTVPIDRKLFVEFGVEDYEEANTRFLLANDRWGGLVIDGSAENMARLRQSPFYWLHNLKAVDAFITRENINTVLSKNGMMGEMGLLSIDIDGVDWWIWEAIEVVQPAIVVIEYNYRFGADEAVTVPYDPAFDRRAAHHSILYYGASLEALRRLGNRKGYALVGVNSAGLNAFFVRRDVLPRALPELTTTQAYVEGQFCEAHDQQGRRIRMSNQEQAQLVLSLPLVRIAEDGTAVSTS